MVVFLISSLLFFYVIYFKAARLANHFDHDEIAGSKVTLVFLLIVAIESLAFFVCNEVISYFHRDDPMRHA